MSIRISFEYANLAKLCESAKCLCEFRFGTLADFPIQKHYYSPL